MNAVDAISLFSGLPRTVVASANDLSAAHAAVAKHATDAGSQGWYRAKFDAIADGKADQRGVGTLHAHTYVFHELCIAFGDDDSARETVLDLLDQWADERTEIERAASRGGVQ